MPSSWVDPADFRQGKKLDTLSPTKPIISDISSTDKVVTQESNSDNKCAHCNCSVPSVSITACDSYFKRILNLLLIQANVKNYHLPKNQARTVPLLLHFTTENLEVLNDYASSEKKDFLWSKIDEAFYSLFEETPVVKDDNTMFTFFELRDYTKFIFITIVGSMTIIGLWLFLTSGSLYKTLVSMVILNFCWSLFWNLNRAYNDEVIKIQQLQNMDGSQSSSFLNNIYKYFSTSTKDDFVHDPMFNVNYGSIVYETLFSFLDILPILGDKSGKMVSNFYASQNVFIRWIVQPAQFLFSPLIFAIAIILLPIAFKGFSIKLPFVSMSFGKENAVNVNSLQDKSQPPLAHFQRRKLLKDRSQSSPHFQRPEIEERNYTAFEDNYIPSKSSHQFLRRSVSVYGMPGGIIKPKLQCSTFTRKYRKPRLAVIRNEKLE